jgi:hypothetical protein
MKLEPRIVYIEGSLKYRVTFEMLIVAQIFQETAFETP